MDLIAHLTSELTISKEEYGWADGQYQAAQDLHSAGHLAGLEPYLATSSCNITPAPSNQYSTPYSQDLQASTKSSGWYPPLFAREPRRLTSSDQKQLQDGPQDLNLGCSTSVGLGSKRERLKSCANPAFGFPSETPWRLLQSLSQLLTHSSQIWVPEEISSQSSALVPHFFQKSDSKRQTQESCMRVVRW